MEAIREDVDRKTKEKVVGSGAIGPQTSECCQLGTGSVECNINPGSKRQKEI